MPRSAPLAPLLGLAGALAAACAPTGSASDLDAARAALRATDSAYSAMAAEGWTPAIAAMLAHDGFLAQGPATPGRGREVARRVLEADTVLARATATWWPIRWDVSADGTRGYSYGYVDAVGPDGQRIPGKYSAYWRREEDGWKAVAYRRGPRPEGDVPPTPDGFGPPADTSYAAFPPADMAALEDSVDATERAFSDMGRTAAGLGPAFATFAAPDAAMFGGGPGMTWGREAIAAAFDGYPAERGFTWHPDIVEVAPSGDLAFTTGPVYPLAGPDGVRPDPVARYFSVWRRQQDGSWRWVIDG